MSLTEEQPTQLDDELSIVCKENCSIGWYKASVVIFNNLLIV